MTLMTAALSTISHHRRLGSIFNRFVFFLSSNRNHYGENHQKYADTLLDYGFFLLNVDAIVRSVHAYTVSKVFRFLFSVHVVSCNWNGNRELKLQRALDIKRHIHGNKNLAVATAEEDLSYALYVLEYSSGNFQSAKDHICKSIDILKVLLPTDHLLLSSARRVKALILEEIALDSSHIGGPTTGTIAPFSKTAFTIAFTNNDVITFIVFRKTKSADRSRRIASIGTENNNRSIRRGECSNGQTLWESGSFVPEHG